MWFEEMNAVTFTVTGHRKGSGWERERETMGLILDMLTLPEEAVKRAAEFDKIQTASPVMTDTFSPFPYFASPFLPFLPFC